MRVRDRVLICTTQIEALEARIGAYVRLLEAARRRATEAEQQAAEAEQALREAAADHDRAEQRAKEHSRELMDEDARRAVRRAEELEGLVAQLRQSTAETQQLLERHAKYAQRLDKWLPMRLARRLGLGPAGWDEKTP